MLIDPAGGGQRLRPDDCQALIRRAVGDGVLFHSGMLRPASKREILARVLRNLRSAHLAARDWPAALGAVDLLAVVEPMDPEHGRDRGLLLGRMGRFGEAIAALSRYLDERPGRPRRRGRAPGHGDLRGPPQLSARGSARPIELAPGASRVGFRSHRKPGPPSGPQPGFAIRFVRGSGFGIDLRVELWRRFR